MERSDSEKMDFIFIQDDAGNRLCKAAWDENGIRLRLKLPGCRGEGSRTVNIDLSEYINLIMKTPSLYRIAERIYVKTFQKKRYE